MVDGLSRIRSPTSGCGCVRGANNQFPRTSPKRCSSCSSPRFDRSQSKMLARNRGTRNLLYFWLAIIGHTIGRTTNSLLSVSFGHLDIALAGLPVNRQNLRGRFHVHPLARAWQVPRGVAPPMQGYWRALGAATLMAGTLVVSQLPAPEEIGETEACDPHEWGHVRYRRGNFEFLSPAEQHRRRQVRHECQRKHECEQKLSTCAVDLKRVAAKSVEHVVDHLAELLGRQYSERQGGGGQLDCDLHKRSAGQRECEVKDAAWRPTDVGDGACCAQDDHPTGDVTE